VAMSLNMPRHPYWRPNLINKIQTMHIMLEKEHHPPVVQDRQYCILQLLKDEIDKKYDLFRNLEKQRPPKILEQKQ
jgi:hypothetical protein